MKDKQYRELMGSLDEIACKARFYAGLLRENPGMILDITEKIANLKLELNKYVQVINNS